MPPLYKSFSNNYVNTILDNLRLLYLLYIFFKCIICVNSKSYSFFLKLISFQSLCILSILAYYFCNYYKFIYSICLSNLIMHLNNHIILYYIAVISKHTIMIFLYNYCLNIYNNISSYFDLIKYIYIYIYLYINLK